MPWAWAARTSIAARVALSAAALLLVGLPTGAARAQEPVRVRAVRDLRPGPPVPAFVGTSGWRGGQPVVWLPAGRLAVDLSTGDGTWVGEPGLFDHDDDGLLTTPFGLWTETPAGLRSLVKTTQWALFWADRLGDAVFVLARRGSRSSLLRLDGGELRLLHTFDPGHPHVASDGRGLWIVGNRGGEPALFRFEPPDRIQPVPLDGAACARVAAVGDRVVLLTDDGLFRLPASGVEPVIRLGPADLRIAGSCRALVNAHAIWPENAQPQVMTDGTEAGTFTFEAEGDPVALLGGEYAASYNAEGIDIVRRDGEVVARQDGAIDARSSGRALFTFSFEDDNDIMGPMTIHRFVPGGDFERWGSVFQGPGMWVPNPDGGALLLHYPRPEPPELVRVDADGREVGRVPVPYGDLESAPTLFGLPGEPQALAALDSGEVVIGSLESGFQVVEPSSGAVLLERPTSQLISSDGRSVYWLEVAEPVSGSEPGPRRRLWRWSRDAGEVVVGTVPATTGASPGVGGRPFLRRVGAGPDPFLQVDAANRLVPVFPVDAAERLSVAVREDGIWALQAHPAPQLAEVLRWSFERGVAEVVGVVDFGEAPSEASERTLQVLGRDPRAWGVQWTFLDAGSTEVRLAPVGAPSAAFTLPGGAYPGAPEVFPPTRSQGLEFGGRVVAVQGDELVPLRGLAFVRGAVASPFGLVLSAEDVPASEGSLSPEDEPPPVAGGLPEPAPRGREPWVVRGTVDPSNPQVQPLGDLFPGPEGSDPAGFAALPDGSGVVFHALSPDRGRELWLWDGSDASARPVCELAPGPAPGIPHWAEIAIGPAAAFVSAFVPEVGTEVVAIPLAGLRGEAACALDSTLPAGGLAASEEVGCGCRTTGRGGGGWLGLGLVAWGVCRRDRAARSA